MIADILKVITQSSTKEDRLIIQLHNENQQLTAQIHQIDNTIDSIPVEQIVTALSHYQTKQHTTKNVGNSINHKLQAIEQFYALCQVQQQQNKKHQLLNEQLTQITQLSHKYDLLGTIALKDFEPEQPNLTFIKQQIQDLTDQLTHWQNQQNVNKFNAEDGEIVQEYNNVVMFLDQFKKTAIQIYAHLVSSNYKIGKSELVIYKEYFDVIWTQQTSFTQNFIEGLSLFLDRFISYDINDRQYTAIVYDLDQNDRMLSIIQKSKIIFDSSEIILHYEHMITSLKNLNLFFAKLQDMTLKQKKSTMQQLKKKNMQKTKEYFEYLLPYLKMEMRRTILSFFDIKQQNKLLNIYELLVNLKIGGHDADIMMSNIQQIIKKIESNPEELKTIMKFIQLAKSDRKSYSMLLFISDQLIEGLEQVQDINHDIAKGIRQLLLIREEMRMKIHEVEL